jgi:predicted NUDIX family NTP pyrophosphohydrolase
VQPVELGAIRQRGGKLVLAWCFAGDWPAGESPRSATFEMEWPPRSGRRASFPEIDRAAMFPLATAREKINPAQVELLDRLERTLADRPPR